MAKRDLLKDLARAARREMEAIKEVQQRLGVIVKKDKPFQDEWHYQLCAQDGRVLTSVYGLDKFYQIVYGIGEFWCAGCGRKIKSTGKKYEGLDDYERPDGTYGICCSSRCLHNRSWAKSIAERLNGDVTHYGQLVARIEGNQYTVNPGDDGSEFRLRGFGGARFMIQFIDGPHKGEVVVSNDVWDEGEIDPQFREALPDNAIFVQEQEASDEQWRHSSPAKE